MAGTQALQTTGIGFLVSPNFVETLQLQTAWKAYQNVFSNYGTLDAYRTLHTTDMVGISDLSITPKGDKALATMQWTNNVGILDLIPSSTVDGYDISDSTQLDFKIRGVTEKSTSAGVEAYASEVGASTSVYDELWPERVEITANGTVGYVGARGGTRREGNKQKFGLMDLIELDYGMSRSDSELKTNGLEQTFLRLTKPDSEEIHSPKRVATFKSINVDGDLISDQVEAYNRFNNQINSFNDTSVIAQIYSEVLTTTIYNEYNAQGLLLPRSGLGYRHNELYGEDVSNAGNPSLIRVIERIGRFWHDDYLDGTTPLPNFVIGNMSPPGWGIIHDQFGFPVHFDERLGDIASVHYVRNDGSNVPFDFVLSNNSGDPVDNSILGDTSLFDSEANYRLVRYLVGSPEITRIYLDPEANSLMSNLSDTEVLLSNKIVSQTTTVQVDNDGIDNDGDGVTDEPSEIGIRRDFDTWMKFLVTDVSVNMTGYVNDVPVPQWEEHRPYGSGVVKTGTTNTKLIFTVDGSNYDPDQYSYYLFFDDTIDVNGVTSEITEVYPNTEYVIDGLNLPTHLHYSDVILKAFYSVHGHEIEFGQDSISLTPAIVNIQSSESGGSPISEVDESFPNGAGLFGVGSTFSISDISQFPLEYRIFFEGLAITDSSGNSLQSGQIIDPDTFTVDSWDDEDLYETEVIVRAFSDSKRHVTEDRISLTRVDIDIFKPNKTSQISDSVEATEGLYLIKNDDDDDDDTSDDDSDSIINGLSDKDDMGKITLAGFDPGVATTVTAELSAVASLVNPGAIRLFDSADNLVSLPVDVTSDLQTGSISYLVEGKAPGEVFLNLTLYNATGKVISTDQVKVFCSTL